MNIREISAEIKKLTKEINDRRREYQEEQDLVDLPLNNDYVYRFKALETRGFAKVKNDTLKANLRGKIYDAKIDGYRFKRKADLEKQLEDLKSFISLDVYTPQGRERFEEAGRNIYDSFKSHYKAGNNFDESEWSIMIEQFDMIKNETENYGYEDQKAAAAYIDAYMKSSGAQKRTFGDTIIQAYKNVKKKGVKAPTYKGILSEAKRLMKKMPSDEDEE